MQFSLAKLIAVVFIGAILFGLVRSLDVVGPLCLPLGAMFMLAACIGYPLAILGSPQKGTQLDPSSNPALPYIHLIAILGSGLFLVFFVYVASDPFAYFNR